jgi:pyridoxal phosphate enzyme (YggS family)
MTTGTQDANGTTLKQRYNDVKSRIAAAAKRVGRRPEDVMLVVVSKSGTVEQIRELMQMGQVDFAENRVQQLLQRAAQIDEWRARHAELGGTAPAIRWHMIGTMQRNKVKKAVEVTRLVQSVDSLRLAEELQVAAAKRETPVEVLVEVNVSGESSKHGVAPGAARHLVAQIETMVCRTWLRDGEMLIQHLEGNAPIRHRARAPHLTREGAGTSPDLKSCVPNPVARESGSVRGGRSALWKLENHHYQQTCARGACARIVSSS